MRKQLKEGQIVLCIKTWIFPSDWAIESSRDIIEFKEGSFYKVPFQNNVIGETGAHHTFNEDFFNMFFTDNFPELLTL